MVAPAAGAVVLVRFPFSDLSKSKLRPAVVLADAGRGDRVLCQITSKPYGDARAIPLEASAFASGSLRVTSYVRPGKLFTAWSRCHAGRNKRVRRPPRTGRFDDPIGTPGHRADR